MSQISDIQGLGTVWRFEIFDHISQSELAVIHTKLRNKISEFERDYSRFKKDSLVSKLNRERNLANPPEELLKILRFAQAYYRSTDGVFNILTEYIQSAHGYDDTYSFVEHEHVNTLPPSPTSDLILSDKNLALTQGTIDLGGIGKGFLIDILASFLQKNNLRHYLINGGGDIFVTSNFNKPVVVYLEHPFIPNTYTHSVSLLNQALGVSSPEKRRWRTQNSQKEFSHIINPEALENISDYGACVVSTTACEADVLATTAVILGYDMEKLNRIFTLTSSTFTIVSRVGTNYTHAAFPGKILSSQKVE